MQHYIFRPANPHNKYVDITFLTSTRGQERMMLQLPAWRPGRYELGNFAQNIQKWSVTDGKGNPLPNQKVTKDCWEVQTSGAEEIVVDYNYYANQLDAGASFFSDNQLYINPVNCLIYVPERIDEPCRVRLENLPEGFRVASGMKFGRNFEAETDSFHTLADSPFIASASLQHHTYTVGEYLFHLWYQGNCRPDHDRIIRDFENFSRVQIEMFGELPVQEYHFLFQMTDHKFYHGVEHLDSTVIALGPGHKMMSKDVYDDFLGISSHELFHSWNIKSIRPAEMYPYDYTEENYSRLFYVAEGVTTYYGDLMLIRSGAYSWEDYAQEWSKFLQRHFHQFGYLYQTLADSSFDSWLDGYKPGAPDRKVNFYVKGMMAAFLLDVRIRRETDGDASLDDVMRLLYHEYAKQGRGYTEEDYLALVNRVSGVDNTAFFEQFIWGLTPMEPALEDAFAYIGCEFTYRSATSAAEQYFGFRLKADEASKAVIGQTAPGSPADRAGLGIGDEIIAVNGMQADKNLDDLLAFFSGEQVRLTFFRQRMLKERVLAPDFGNYFAVPIIEKSATADSNAMKRFQEWTGMEFLATSKA